ncbi:hypothetical protein QBC32DRAFT_42625 [Pseudoneurospora amorphoporcata]|uniref:Uncharacterized protein n=1 Tax=Pseudoneurospora amorphoporcata TaxID=241081 RepID=A0AAN6NSI5_9PEZI|nr:hypothetical protein QBC32DRAFT_42625 [Pseudoneurospora amorphoporcata]
MKHTKQLKVMVRFHQGQQLPREPVRSPSPHRPFTATGLFIPDESTRGSPAQSGAIMPGLMSVATVRILCNKRVQKQAGPLLASHWTRYSSLKAALFTEPGLQQAIGGPPTRVVAFLSYPRPAGLLTSPAPMLPSSLFPGTRLFQLRHSRGSAPPSLRPPTAPKSWRAVGPCRITASHNIPAAEAQSLNKWLCYQAHPQR